jgi:hypothetical protein
MWFDLTYQLEWTNIVFKTSLEANMFEIEGVGDNSLEDIAEHEVISFDVLGLRESEGPCDIENMSNIS